MTTHLIDSGSEHASGRRPFRERLRGMHCVALLVGLLSMGVAQASDDWRVRMLPLPTGASTMFATGIDNLGRVYGYVAMPESRTSAALWTPGADGEYLGTILDYPGDAFPFGGNRSGAIVGRGHPSFNTAHATVWVSPDATGVTLPVETALTPYEYTQANSVNDAGLVVGQRDRRAMVWEPGSAGRLLPMPEGMTGSSANAVNNGQTIVGAVWDASRSARLGVWRLQGGVATFLDSADAGPGSYAYDVNDSGEIAGFVRPVESMANRDPMVWRLAVDGTLQAVPLPEIFPERDSQVEQINSAGSVVGYVSVPGTQFVGYNRAVLWEKDADGQYVLVDLTTRLGSLLPGTSTVSGLGLGINDDGWIVMTGGATGLLVLTPVPEPSGAALLMLGALVLGLNRRLRGSSPRVPHFAVETAHP